MSGLEIVGVVLGAWPVLTGGLKLYKGYKNVFRYEQMMKSFMRKLSVERLRFYYSCEKLVSGLAKTSGEQEDLLQRPSARVWKTSLINGLEEKLEERLGDNLSAYTETIEQIATDLLELSDLLGIGQEKESNQDGHKSKKKTWREEKLKKIKDCFNHDKHLQLLASIKESNTDLERLLPGALDEEAHETSSQRQVDISHLEAIRRSAISLHCALCSGWLCRCQPSHSARMRLDARVGMRAAKTEKSRFSITLSYPWSGDIMLQPTEIEPGDDDATSETASHPSQVRFALPKAPSAPSKNCITSLCGELVRCHGSQMGSCLGYIPNAEQKHYIHLVKPSSVIDRMIPLHDLLLDTGSTRPLKIRLKERYKMALVLASSLFQLCSTSWLDTKWSSRDIEVVKTQSDSKLGDHAFICTPFTSGTIPTDNPDISGYNSGLRKLAIKNEAIFALGIILLELSISTTLQSQQTDEDRKCHELADLKTAIRIAEQEADDNVQFWNAAVKKCLDCDFGEEPNFEKKAFREKFYEGVVAPLKNLYEMI